MILLFSSTGLFEVFIFLVAVTTFVLAVRFFIDSRKRLSEAFPDLFSSCKLLLPATKEKTPTLQPQKLRSWPPPRREQNSFPQKFRNRFEEMQRKVEQLQERLQRIEEQSRPVTELTMHSDHDRAMQLQPERKALSKEELCELSNEKQQLQVLVTELQEKLSQSALQRQQLLRRVKVLEDINADMQVSESNKNLKAETTYAAELKSMTELMVGS